jgi:hypothetical protein
MSAPRTVSGLRATITALLADEQRGCSFTHLDSLLKKLIKPDAELTRLRAVNAEQDEMLKGVLLSLEAHQSQSTPKWLRALAFKLNARNSLSAHEAAKGRP